jgi:DNA-binding response OmpR family regulator
MKDRFVLIVEDNFMLAEVYSEVLHEIGFEAEIIADGGLAFSRIKEVIPALVILDLHLPHVSGVEIFREIRLDEQLADTRVIIITADARGAEDIRQEVEIVLVKPVRMDVLQSIIVKLFMP